MLPVIDDHWQGGAGRCNKDVKFIRRKERNSQRQEVTEAYFRLKTWFRIERKVINSSSDPLNVLYMGHSRLRIQDAVDDIEDNRILKEEEDVMGREAGEINDGDLVEDENVDDEIEGNTYAFQTLLRIRASSEA